MHYTLKPRDEALGALLLNIVLILLVAIGEASSLPIGFARLIASLIVVIFLPGYMLHLIFFPRQNDLTGTERLAVSFALSIAIIPPLAVFLDALPGLSLAVWPILLSESLVITLAAGGAWLRRHFVAEADRFRIVITWTPGAAWRALSNTERVLYALLGLMALAALFAAAAILLAPRPARHFTEFYLLNNEGLAQDFPRTVSAGDAVEVIVGISNRENHVQHYQLEIYSESYRLMTVDAFQLRPQENIEIPVSFILESPGENTLVIFHLYEGQDRDLYRELRLIVDVVE